MILFFISAVLVFISINCKRIYDKNSCDKKLKEIRNNIRGLDIVVDRKGYILDFNKKAEKEFNLKGKGEESSIYEFLAEKEDENFYINFNNIIINKISQEIEAAFINANGKKIICQVNFIYQNDDTVEIIAWDKTSQIQYEEKICELRKVIKDIEGDFQIHQEALKQLADLGTGVAYVYSMKTHMWKFFGDNDRIIGQATKTKSYDSLIWNELTHPEDRDYRSANIVKFYREEIDSLDIKYRMMHSNGEYKYVRSIAKLYNDKKRNDTLMIGAFTDIVKENKLSSILGISYKGLTYKEDAEEIITNKGKIT